MKTIFDIENDINEIFKTTRYTKKEIEYVYYSVGEKELTIEILNISTKIGLDPTHIIKVIQAELKSDILKILNNKISFKNRIIHFFKRIFIK